jgi:hypothetical protein
VPTCWTSASFEARYGVPAFGGIPTVTTIPAAPGGGTAAPRAQTGANPRASGEGATAAALTVDLWLMMSAPGRPEQSLHRALRVAADPVRFAFDPVALPSAGPDLRTVVSGRLTVRRTGGGQGLMVHLDRRLLSQTGPVDGSLEFSFAGTYALPAPGDVLSLEMPAVRLGTGEASERLSLRLRATPAP